MSLQIEISLKKMGMTRKKQLSQYDRMTGEPVVKLLAELSVPTVISMMVMNIYNLVDTAFVGTLGTSQSGAAGIVFSFMAILQAVSVLAKVRGISGIQEAQPLSFVLSFVVCFILPSAGIKHTTYIQKSKCCYHDRSARSY